MMYLGNKPKMDFLRWKDRFSDEEMVLLEEFFVMNKYKYNPGNIDKIWYENGLLCVRYEDDNWWHYNVKTSEWW